MKKIGANSCLEGFSNMSIHYYCQQGERQDVTRRLGLPALIMQAEFEIKKKKDDRAIQGKGENKTGYQKTKLVKEVSTILY